MHFLCELEGLSLIYKLKLFRFLSDLYDLENELQGQSHNNKNMALVGRRINIICLFDFNSMVFV